MSLYWSAVLAVCLLAMVFNVMAVLETRKGREVYVGRHRAGSLDSCTPAYIAARLRYQKELT